MPAQRDRRSRDRAADKPPRKLQPFLHYLAAFALGWHLKGFFPDASRLIDLIGDGWDWFLGSIQGLGGLMIIGSFLTIVFNLYEKIQARRKANQNE